MRWTDHSFRSASGVAYSAYQGGEHRIHHRDRRDLLPRRTRLPPEEDERPIREVDLFGDDASCAERHDSRDRHGFDEQVLFDQDAY